MGGHEKVTAHTVGCPDPETPRYGGGGRVTSTDKNKGLQCNFAGKNDRGYDEGGGRLVDGQFARMRGV